MKRLGIAMQWKNWEIVNKSSHTTGWHGRKEALCRNCSLGPSFHSWTPEQGWTHTQVYSQIQGPSLHFPPGLFYIHVFVHGFCLITFSPSKATKLEFLLFKWVQEVLNLPKSSYHNWLTLIYSLTVGSLISEESCPTPERKKCWETGVFTPLVSNNILAWLSLLWSHLRNTVSIKAHEDSIL